MDTTREVKRRDRLFIISLILERAKEPAKEADIMYDVRLSFSQTKQYLSFLTRIRCLEQVNRKGKITYRTTKKGLVYLENYNKISGILISEDENPQ